MKCWWKESTLFSNQTKPTQPFTPHIMTKTQSEYRFFNFPNFPTSSVKYGNEAV